MDNVLNRPLFRHREARDRLNDIAGVQRFKDGGDVRPSGLPSLADAFKTGMPITPAMVLDNLIVRAGTTMRDPGTVMEALNEKLADPNLRQNERRALESQRSALNFAIEAGYGATDAVTDALSVLQSLGSGVLEYGVAPVVSTASPALGEMIYDQIPMFEASAEELARMGQAVPSNLRPSDTPKNVAFEAAGRGTPPLRPAASGMEAEARESRPRGGLLPTPGPTPESAFKGPSGMEQEARGRGPMTPALGPSGMEQEARDRGPMITNPAEVAAGLNAEDPAVRERTVADFMQEYAAAAPEYKGMDKNLLLAQIGFAIAAGESPNAMQNIANGLLAGSDAMLKDKAAKDEFDRQVQLAAMQYGFGEVAQERALGRQFTDYVTSKEVTYRGKKYGPNESIPVLHSDIINGRMPEGVISEATSDALATNFAAVQKSLQEQLKNRTLSGQEYEAAITKLETAAKDYTSANSMIPLLEASLERVNDEVSGGVTGADAWLYTTINRISNFVGLNPADQLENVEKYNADMQDVAVRFASEILGESGRTISDQDRVLIQDLVGLIKDKDFLSAYAKDPNILTSKIQKLIRKAESNRDNALGSYTTTMRGYAGAYSPGGADIYSDVAEQTFNPEALAAPQIEFEWDPENKRLVLKK